MVLTQRGVIGPVAVGAMVVAGLAGWPGGARAQAPLPGIDVKQREQRPAPKQTLDVEALVVSQDVLPTAAVDDPVWSIQPQPGRRLIQVPIIVEPLEEDAELAQPLVDLRGGRFIGWRIVPADETTQGRQSQPLRGSPDMPTADSRRMGQFFQNGQFGPGGPGGPMPQDPQRRAINTAAAALDGGLPDGAPRMTRKLLVHPDGSISWTLERVLPGATVKDAQEGYALKLRPDLIAAMEPERPQANTGGGDPIQARQQRREAQLRFQQEVQAFRQLRESVRELPEQFEAPLPPRLWAVYEVPASAAQIGFAGEPPLPWGVGMTELETLRSTGGGSRGGGPGAQGLAAAATFDVMARGGHPLTHRAIAYALHSANLVGQAQVNDPLYQVLGKIIAGPDDTARRIIVEDLATTIPPTSATAALLRDAARHMTPQMQLVALQGLLQGNPNDAQQLRDMVDNANRTMADPNGPDAGLVLEAIAEGVADLSGQAGPTFITGINFDNLPEERRDQAIAYVVRGAGQRPLAAAWLNHRLLGSNNQATVRRTLELLSRATGATGVLQPVGEALTRAVFGEPRDDAGPKLDLTVTQPIPIDTTSHGIFRGINSGDPSIRALAWQALPNFTVTPATDPRRGPSQPTPAAEDIVAQILVAGLSQKPTPPQLARFLARQRGSDRATSGLVEVVLYGDGAAAKAASRALVGSGRNLAAALDALQPEARAEFAGQLYHNVEGHAPLVTGLLAASDAGMAVRSFAGAVAQGQLPDPADIAEQFGDERALLALAASPEPRVAAGGVAALVALAGGDDLAAQELAQRFQNSSDRSPAALGSAWATAKKDIYARRLADAAGPYRVQLRLFDSGMGGMGGPPPEFFDEFGGQGFGEEMRTPSEVVPIGVVDLNVDGQAVYLGNQTVNFTLADDRLGLRLNAADLRAFQIERLNEVPFDRLLEPVTLTPSPDGSWRGSGRLPDGTLIEVVLEPMAQ